MFRVCSLSAVTLPNCRAAVRRAISRSEAVTLVLGLTHGEVKRELVVDVAGARPRTQQRQQPIPPADRVMEALHDGHHTCSASRA